jgi:triacylglycerol esterase/lipase EstA (alpha/beta hydrolase family)
MAMLEELRAVGSAALQLPGVLRRRACEGRHQVAGDNVVRCPVVLVHGYGGTDSVWTPLRRALVDAGFGHLVSLNYNSFANDPASVAAELEASTLRALADSGARRAHLIGHSLGGLIVRYAINHAGLAPIANAAVTIATPHRGTVLARLALGRCAQIMLPHSAVRDSLDAAPSNVRWLAYYSDADRVVLPESARLSDPHYRATNLLIPGCGHLTICRDPRLISSLVSELIRTESSGVAALRADGLRAAIAA